MRFKFSSVIALLLLLSLLTNRLSAQPFFRYCIVPENRDWIQTDGDIRFECQSQVLNDITKTIIQISRKDGKAFKSGQTFVSIDALYPVGKQLEMNFGENGLAAFKYDPFYARSEDSIAIYVVHIDGKISYAAGPIYLCRYRVGESEICNRINERFRPRKRPSGTTPVLTENLPAGNMVPNRDGLELLRILNWRYADSSTQPSTDRLVYPVFPAPVRQSAKRFNKQYRKDKRPDRKLSAEFVREVDHWLTIVDSLLHVDQVSTDPSALEARRDLNQLTRELGGTLKRSRRIGKTSLAYILESLKLLTNSLRVTALESQSETIKILARDARRFIAPYHNFNTFEYLGNNQYSNSPFSYHATGQRNIYAVGETYSTPEIFNGSQYADPALRKFYFYMLKVSWVDTVINGKVRRKPVPTLDGDDIAGIYDVYCVPEGPYLLYTSGKLSLTDLSTYKCTERASIGYKSLRLAPYYFFAVSIADSARRISSTPEKYNTGDIPKKSTFSAHPYAFTIKLN